VTSFDPTGPRVLVVTPDPAERRLVAADLVAAGLRPHRAHGADDRVGMGWDVVLTRDPWRPADRRRAVGRPWIVALVDPCASDVVARALLEGCDDYLVTPHAPGAAALRVRVGLAARMGAPPTGSGVDPLTGLRDEEGFERALRSEADRGARLAVAALGIDGLVRINTAVADRAILEASRRLTATAGPADALARIGGGGFAWLLPGAGAEEAMASVGVAYSHLRAIEIPGWGGLPVSIGVAAAESAIGEGAIALRRASELALADAKRLGTGMCLAPASEPASTPEGDPAMRALVMAITTKDPQIDRHSARVADLCVRLGAALGWHGERLARMRAAALLHDVGKLAIRQEVLTKEGPLDDGERADMRWHAEVGAAIVAEVLSPEQGRWVRAHHERWDGAGYPDGLMGEQIPPEGRLIAVADAWDAMTAGRVYRAPLTLEEALTEMRDCAGAQFWPVAVRVLADVVEGLPSRSDDGALATAGSGRDDT